MSKLYEWALDMRNRLDTILSDMRTEKLAAADSELSDALEAAELSAIHANIGRYVIDPKFTWSPDELRQKTKEPEMDPINDWDRMTVSERRRWALEKINLCKLAVAYSEEIAPDDEIFRRAELLVNYITSGLPPSEPSALPSGPDVSPEPPLSTPTSEAQSGLAA